MKQGGSAELPALEPLSVGHLALTGFALWRRDFGSVSLLVSLLHIPVAVTTFAYMASVVISVTDEGAYVVEDAEAFGDVTNFLGVLDVLAAFLSVAIVFAFLCRRYPGADAGIGDTVVRTMSRSPSYFVLSVVFWGGIGISVSIAAGTGPVGVVFVALGLVLATRFALSHPAFWHEEVSPFVAMARGARLAQGRLGELLAVVTLGVVPTAVLYFGVGALLGSMLESASVTGVILADVLDTPIGAVIALPVLPALVTVAYYDARVRGEGYAGELSRRPT